MVYYTPHSLTANERARAHIQVMSGIFEYPGCVCKHHILVLKKLDMLAWVLQQSPEYRKHMYIQMLAVKSVANGKKANVSLHLADFYLTCE